MMKRFFALALCFALLTLLIPIQIHAAGREYAEIIPLEDGYYLVAETVSIDTRGIATKGGTKTYTMYNSSDEALWKVQLFGLFQYNGSTSECTNADCAVTIYDNAWSVDSESTTHGGNTAFTTVALKSRELGVVTNRETCNLSLSCDKNGNLS